MDVALTMPELETWGCPVGLILHIHPYAQIIRLCASFFRIFPRIPVNYKGKDDNFPMGSPGWHHCNQGIKVNIISDDTT